MAKNKIIFGIGNVPKASDFSIGELVINVTDQKVFSKDKQNVVFEIKGTTSSTTPSNIDTGSFYLSSSFNNNIITFDQGDGGTDSIDLSSLTVQDSDWFIDTSNSRLTSSLDVYVEGNITASGNISASGFVATQYVKLRDNNTLPSAEKGIIIYSSSNFYAGI